MRHVVQHRRVAVRLPRAHLGLGVGHRVLRAVERAAARETPGLRPHHVVEAHHGRPVRGAVRLVALAHGLVGVRCPLVPDDSLLVGVVGLVGASRANDVRRDDDKGSRAVGRDLLVCAAQLRVLVVEALGDELLESLADASYAGVEPLEVRGDPYLHRGLHAPSDAVHHERHELLVVVDPEYFFEVREVPVRASGPLEVQLVVQPCRRVELVDDGERVVRADAIGVRNLFAASEPDAHVRGAP